MNRAFTNALCMVLAIFVSGAATAAVPLSWEVKPGQASPVAFDRFHGESLQLSAEFVGFSEPPFAPGADVRLWYQTNGMGSAWWSVPASVESNRVSAAWSPELDPGAERVNLFFGAPSNAYCSAVLRLRGSPGMVPNVLPLPVQRLDFAALEVTNAPYYTQTETDAKIVELAPAPGNYAAVSNAAMSASAATNDFVRKHGDTVTGTLTVKGAGIGTQKTTIGNTGISTPNITLGSSMEMAWLYPWCLTVRSEYAEDDETFYYPVGSGGGTIALTKNIDAAAAAATNHAAAAAASAYADATNNAAQAYVKKSGGTIAGTLSITNSQGDAETGAHLVVTGDSIDGPQGEVTIGPARFLGLDFYNWSEQRSEPSLDIYDVDKTYIHGKLFAVDEIRLDVTYPPRPEVKDPYLSMTSNGFRCVAMAHGQGRSDGLGFDAEDLYRPFIEVSSTEEQAGTGYPLYKYKIRFPTKSGTVALIEDISPNNTTFSNAVLSVGLGIDTNAVAAINALVEQGEELPIGGATTVGALLLALAGAIAALQRNKADISQLRYSFNAVTVPSGQTPTIAGLSDRAINAMTLGASVTWASIIFPARTSGARDFFLRLTIEGTTPPTLSFSEADGNAVAFDAADSGWANIQPGVNLLMFTDTTE